MPGLSDRRAVLVGMRAIDTITLFRQRAFLGQKRAKRISNADVAPEEQILQQRAAFAVPLRRKMADYRADGVDANVSGIVRIRRVFGFSKAIDQIAAEGSWLRLSLLRARFGSAALRKVGKPKLAATI